MEFRDVPCIQLSHGCDFHGALDVHHALRNRDSLEVDFRNGVGLRVTFELDDVWFRELNRQLDRIIELSSDGGYVVRWFMGEKTAS